MSEHENTEGGWLRRLVSLEPAVVRGALVSVFAFLALFGFDWATETNAITVVTTITAVLPLVAGVLIRPGVIPVAKSGAERIEEGGYEAGEAAPYPEGTPVDIVVEDSPKTRDY